MAVGMGTGSVLGSIGTWCNITVDSYYHCCHRGEIK